MAVIEMESGGQMNENMYGKSFLGCEISNIEVDI